MRKVLILFILIAVPVLAGAQSDKKLEGTIELFDSDPAKAIEKLRGLIDKEGEDARIEAWDLLVDMHERLYLIASSPENPERQQLQYMYNFLNYKRDSILQIDESLRSTDDAKLLGDIEADMMSLEEKNYQLHAGQYEAFVAVCRESTVRSKSSKGDMQLRALFLPSNPDTFDVDAKELEIYNDVNDLIAAGKYAGAEQLLGPLRSKYPDSYSIISSCYWLHAYQNNTDSAKFYLNKMISLYPNMIFPYENMAKLQFNEGDFYGAKKSVYEMLKIYPGQDIKNYYREILSIENKELVENKIYRDFEPNMMVVMQPEVPEEWKPYRQARISFASNCDETGVLDNRDGTFSYMEVECWKALLDHHRDKPPSFLSYAYEMEKTDDFDCFIMFNMFHFDIYGQYMHWINHADNSKRMIGFIEKNLVNYKAPEE